MIVTAFFDLCPNMGISFMSNGSSVFQDLQGSVEHISLNPGHPLERHNINKIVKVLQDTCYSAGEKPVSGDSLK